VSLFVRTLRVNRLIAPTYDIRATASSRSQAVLLRGLSRFCCDAANGHLSIGAHSGCHFNRSSHTTVILTSLNQTRMAGCSDVAHPVARESRPPGELGEGRSEKKRRRGHMGKRTRTMAGGTARAGRLGVVAG